jgi:polysaccharide pyruvyl transferase WcaK-like protein
MAKDLMKAVGYDITIASICSTQDLIKIVSRCKLIIGARMHPLIVGINQNTPVFAFPLNPKTKSLFQDLIKKSEWLISFDNTSYEDDKNQIDYFLSNQDKIRKELSEIKAYLQKCAFMSFEIVYNKILAHKKMLKSCIH